MIVFLLFFIYYVLYAFSGCWWRFHTPLLSVVAAQEEATTRRGRDIDRGRMMIYILLLVLCVCFLFFVGRCSTIISTITNAPHISSSILVVVIIFILIIIIPNTTTTPPPPPQQQ